MLDSSSAVLEDSERQTSESGRIRGRDVAVTIAVGLGILAAALVFTQPGQAVEEAGTSQAVSVPGQAKGPGPTIGRPAPDFEVQGLDGATLRLSDFRGRPVWINFFATWCPPCRAETPDLQAAYEDAQRRGTGLALLAIDMGEDAPTVRRYVQKLGMTYTVGLDTSFEISADYRVRGLPTHLFIDRDGVVQDIKVSILSPEVIRRQLAQIE